MVTLMTFCLAIGNESARAQSQAAAPLRRQEPPILLAYLPGWRELNLDAVPWDHLTHLCHAFVRGTPEGELVTSANLPSRELTDRAHRAGVQVLLSIGGARSDGYLNPIAADPDRLARFVSQVVKIVEDNGYDGVDLDWEHPDSESSAQGMIDMVRALRGALGECQAGTGKRYLFTAAVTGEWAYRHIPTEVFRDHFDFLNVMTYDLAGSWSRYAGHHAPLGLSSQAKEVGAKSIETSINHWLVDRGLPPSRLVLGLPAYGRGFRGIPHPYAPITKDPDKHTEYGYSELAKKIAQGWTVQRLDNGEPWLVSPDRSEFIGFDDPDSIRQKTIWALGKGLRGVFFWQVLADRLPDGSHPLIESAHQALNAQPQAQ